MGLLPALALSIGAYELIKEFFNSPSLEASIELLMGIGGFAGAIGFILAIFFENKQNKIAVFLLLYGVLSMSLLSYSILNQRTIPWVGVIICSIILLAGIANIINLIRNKNA